MMKSYPPLRRFTFLLAGSLLMGCGTVTVDKPATQEAPLNSGGSAGTPIEAEGAFTCDFSLPGAMPLAQVPAVIERDRMYMAERPGMLTKRLPIALDPATGNLFSGGRYLFDTEEHAREYAHWVRNGFRLDGTLFLERPFFIAPDCHAWSVVRAREFAPLDAQVVVRTERFVVPDGRNARPALLAHWPAIAAEAEARGLSAVWLVYNPEERLASLIYYANRVGPADANALDFASLAALQQAAPLGDAMADLGWQRNFDRTEWVLTVWFPFVAGDRGQPSLWPYSPPLPAPFCGDGVCEVSRGESGDTCSADCLPTCGDAVCAPGEDTVHCPGDCRL